jgi:hypothetical protein
LVGRVHETLVPFTHVERGLVGDRFGETYEPIPRDADYVCQIHPQREAPYYWWLPSGTHYGPDALDEQNALAFHFRYGGNSEDVVGEGWSHAEGDFRWMTGYASTLHLPPLPHSGDYALRINVHPMLYGALNLQRLGVLLNGRPIQDFEIVGDMIVGTMLSAHDLRRDGSDQLTLVHPDSLTPAALTGWSVDMRILSMALRQLTLVPVHA